MVVIFIRESNPHCKIMLEHMGVLCQRHLETRFLWVPTLTLTLTHPNPPSPLP